MKSFKDKSRLLNPIIDSNKYHIQQSNYNKSFLSNADSAVVDKRISKIAGVLDKLNERLEEFEKDL